MNGLPITWLKAWFSSTIKKTWSAAGIVAGVGEGLGAGLGVGDGVGAGVGVGVAAIVELDARTAPPPQPTATKRREQNRTRPTIFGPMGTVSCTQRR